MTLEVRFWAINTSGRVKELPVSLEPCLGYSLSANCPNTINRYEHLQFHFGKAEIHWEHSQTKITFFSMNTQTISTSLSSNLRCIDRNMKAKNLDGKVEFYTFGHHYGKILIMINCVYMCNFQVRMFACG